MIGYIGLPRLLHTGHVREANTLRMRIPSNYVLVARDKHGQNLAISYVQIQTQVHTLLALA